MKTELKDVIHLYLGCQCVLTEDVPVEEFDDDQTKKGSVWSLLMINYGDFDLIDGNGYKFVLQDEETCWLGVHGSEFKLLLRPLSSVTEEEAIELIGIQLENYPNKLDIKMKSFGRRSNSDSWQFSAYEGEKHIISGSLSFYRHEPKKFMYLLSKGFDLFGLIESNQAIDSSTLNKTE